ncbi:unnamed protein product, partial [Scytosiphon promiscuus]
MLRRAAYGEVRIEGWTIPVASASGKEGQWENRSSRGHRCGYAASHVKPRIYPQQSGLSCQQQQQQAFVLLHRHTFLKFQREKRRRPFFAQVLSLLQGLDGTLSSRAVPAPSS